MLVATITVSNLKKQDFLVVMVLTIVDCCAIYDLEALVYINLKTQNPTSDAARPSGHFYLRRAGWPLHCSVQCSARSRPTPRPRQTSYAHVIIIVNRATKRRYDHDI